MNWNKLLLMLLAVFPLVAPAYAAVCELPDNGAGTIDLPPDCPHGYIGQMSIIDGLPPGTTIEIDAVLRDFYNVVRTPGGSLGGEIQTWQAQLDMAMTGTGMLAGYSRFIVIGVQGETHSAPSGSWQPVQSFDTDLVQMFGQVLGDPDFDLLRVTAGANYGLPSPGHTTLTQLPGGDWAVDSFFDITYRIDFVGTPGGPLAGMSGSTTLVNQFQAGESLLSSCVLPDNGAGTIDLPPDCPHGYIGQMSIIDGLPPGTTIESDAVLRNFFNVVRTPGGSLGGEIQTWQAQLELSMTGTGMLAGYSRFIVIGVQGETHSAPSVPWQPVQSFDTDLVQLFGQVLGDPDFDLLRVTAGTNFGMPSPGHTTLTQLPGGDWAVDSFFDITYRIDFIGAPGGPLAGMSGSTTLVSHFQAGGSYPSELAEAPGSSRFILLANTPNPFSAATTIEYYAPPQGGSVTVKIFDVAGHVVRTLTPGHQSPGLQRVEWNGRDERGLLAGTGVYFYRLQAPGFEKSMKMMMCR